MIMLPPGLAPDRPLLSPEPRWHTGVNTRVADGHVETLGLFGPLRGTSGSQITLPGSARYRSVFTTPSPATGQILAGSSTHLRLMEFDPGSSTPGAPPRWGVYDVVPAGLPAASDTLTDPNAGRVGIPPVWWFSDQDDVVIGSRANVATEPCYAWGRSNASPFAALSGSPLGAVSGGIINRICMLMGCTSLTEPDPLRYMTVRWSDRFNFEEWTPSDTNLSGELQLEGGSRIVGGGVSPGFGGIAWTDKRMALFHETGDPDSVFAREYVAGGRGLLANRAWCEADGIIWWLDESRTLNAYDGGRPRQIDNPLRVVTTERISDKDVARVYMVANPDYREILIWFPTANSGDPDACLVFNYGSSPAQWSYWQLSRTAWCPRFGVIPNLAINTSNEVFRHDIDLPFANPWAYFDPLNEATWQLPAPALPANADITPYNFVASTNMITAPGAAGSRLEAKRFVFDHTPSPAAGATGDTLTLKMIAYGETSVTAAKIIDVQTLAQGTPGVSFRGGGRALQYRVEGLNQKTVWRFGLIDTAMREVGSR